MFHSSGVMVSDGAAATAAVGVDIDKRASADATARTVTARGDRALNAPSLLMMRWAASDTLSHKGRGSGQESTRHVTTHCSPKEIVATTV
jgi:hypothetical protein